jgi:hypothetical protein
MDLEYFSLVTVSKMYNVNSPVFGSRFAEFGFAELAGVYSARRELGLFTALRDFITSFLKLCSSTSGGFAPNPLKGAINIT